MNVYSYAGIFIVIIIKKRRMSCSGLGPTQALFIIALCLAFAVTWLTKNNNNNRSKSPAALKQTFNSEQINAKMSPSPSTSNSSSSAAAAAAAAQLRRGGGDERVEEEEEEFLAVEDVGDSDSDESGDSDSDSDSEESDEEDAGNDDSALDIIRKVGGLVGWYWTRFLASSTMQALSFCPLAWYQSPLPLIISDIITRATEERRQRRRRPRAQE